eukprot:NODE_1603_length_1358_cov_67.145149_g1328_i0.p2 GENE.NODE_1603_length_1358_cov_67.145149_g1328_i0~~NODE_1603_length_1358_cov_67.145149_g1328_i0.p2  ORF type:complete len:365 (+),score=93.45 NODE_1603_length_1358_cov_67.145149_g1328_i0:92-1186(+)
MAETIRTPLTDLLGIKYPVVLAGMNQVSGPDLAAAVTNAGGLGVVGGVTYTPKFLRNVIKELKAKITSDKPLFGIDLLLPQVGGSARKTNRDYTGGKLPELIDIICESGAKLFVSAVGVPPAWAVEKLHAKGILVMNMIGSTRHVQKCLDAGVDLLCAQGTEGGGHTGAIATTVLIPQVVDMCKGVKSPLHGGPVHVLAAGGIYDGRGLAMALSLGAAGVWVGTRFICAKEAGCPPRHQQAVIASTSEDTIRSIVYTGRPMRVIQNPYVLMWERQRAQEIEELTSKGVIPVEADMKHFEKGEIPDNVPQDFAQQEHDIQTFRPLLSGQACGAVKEILPAKDIVEQMVSQAISILKLNAGRISKL